MLVMYYLRFNNQNNRPNANFVKHVQTEQYYVANLSFVVLFSYIATSFNIFTYVMELNAPDKCFSLIYAIDKHDTT